MAPSQLTTNTASRTVVNEKRGPGLEEALFTLRELAPEVLETLPQMFKNAVLETVKYGPYGNYSGLLAALNRIDLTQRFGVFRTLESLYGDRASQLERAIERKFESEVLDILGRATSRRAALLELIEA